MVSNTIRSSIRLYRNVSSNRIYLVSNFCISITPTLSKIRVDKNWTIRRGEMMKKDTVIKLIKLTLKNFEETNDVEHLNDIIQIIFEYKKSQQRHLLTRK